MDEEKLDLILEKIEELEEKIDDNNSILHSERNAKRWTKLFWIIKWILIIATGIIAWSYLEPIYRSSIETFDKISQTSKEINESTKGLRENLKKVQNIDKNKILEDLKNKIKKD